MAKWFNLAELKDIEDLHERISQQALTQAKLGSENEHGHFYSASGRDSLLNLLRCVSFKDNETGMVYYELDAFKQFLASSQNREHDKYKNLRQFLLLSCIWA